MDALTGPAERYGLALLEMAVEENTLTAVTGDLETARRVFAETELTAFIGNPAVPAQAKLELIDRLFQGKTSETFFVFLKVIINRRRERLLPGIVQAAYYQCLARQGIEVVFVTTSHEMDEDLKRALRERLEAVLGKRLYLEYRMNKNLIGGIVIRHGDGLLDASILGMLRRIQEMLESKKIT